MLINTVNIELIGEVPSYIGVGIQTLMAITLGGLVGYDREKKSKAAGLKTHMLICLGSSIFTSMGILSTLLYGGMSDPNRIAAQIVSGIGFLGAGAIIRGREHVTGLTSAATIWLVAAIGYTIGIGYPFTAAGFTVTVLVVLTVISPIYKLIFEKDEEKYYQLEVLSRGSIKRNLLGVVLSEDVEVDEIFEEILDEKKSKYLSSIFLKASSRQMDQISHGCNGLLQVEKVTYHSVLGSVKKIIKSFQNDLL